MLKRFITCFSLLALLSISGFGWTQDARCPSVNCDCSAFSGGAWRESCENHEAVIKQECIANQGIPTRYCGLHGPKGTPAATSLQLQPVDAPSDTAVQALQQEIDTQYWSLKHDLQSTQAREEQGRYNESLQVLGMLERNFQDLFVMQQKVLAGLGKADNQTALRTEAASFADRSETLSLELGAYSENLWRKISEAQVKQEASQILAFKVARAAASGYEQVAYLLSVADAPADSAAAWRRSALIAQRLSEWEELTENRAQHLTLYREQAAARWHRATYEWLSEGDSERALSSRRNARRSSLSYAEKVLAEAEEGGDPDARAIKKP